MVRIYLFSIFLFLFVFIIGALLVETRGVELQSRHPAADTSETSAYLQQLASRDFGGS